MPREPGTVCSLRVSHWGDWAPEFGDFLRTSTGTCYRIDEVKGNRLICTRLDRNAVAFGEPGVWGWQWDARRRSR